MTTKSEALLKLYKVISGSHINEEFNDDVILVNGRVLPCHYLNSLDDAVERHGKDVVQAYQAGIIKPVYLEYRWVWVLNYEDNSKLPLTITELNSIFKETNYNSYKVATLIILVNGIPVSETNIKDTDTFNPDHCLEFWNVDTGWNYGSYEKLVATILSPPDKLEINKTSLSIEFELHY